MFTPLTIYFIIFHLLEEYKPATMLSKKKNGIIVHLVRHNKVIPSYKPEQYNIIEMNDYAD